MLMDVIDAPIRWEDSLWSELYGKHTNFAQFILVQKIWLFATRATFEWGPLHRASQASPPASDEYS
jgi:hypothetical protein